VPDDETTKDPKVPPPEDEPSALDRAKELLDASPKPAGAGENAPEAEEGEDEESDTEEEDLASPEAIARRVAALGEEDAVEVIARQEEERLAARRKLQKKKKKGGLEAAASKRLSKIGAKAPVKSSLPTPAEAAPLVDRAVKLGDWAKKNQGTVSAVVGAGVLALAGVGAYTYYEKRQETQASVELAKAIADEKGRIGDPDKEDDEGRPHDPRPVFKTAEDMREAALKKYRVVESKWRGTGAAILARLEEGSLLLDKHDIPGARSAFDDVKDSPLAKADAEVHGRALEGLGFAKELEAEGQQGDARKASLEDAGKIYRELENTDVLGFQELAMYHQARIFEKQGDTAKAIDMLKKLHERVTKPGENHPFATYLEHVSEDRLRALDPTALPAKAAGQLGGPGGNQLSQAQMRRMIEQAQKNQQKGKTSPGQKPGGPPGPAGPVPQPEDLPP
jgi:hypothetical protein